MPLIATLMILADTSSDIVDSVKIGIAAILLAGGRWIRNKLVVLIGIVKFILCYMTLVGTHGRYILHALDNIDPERLAPPAKELLARVRAFVQETTAAVGAIPEELPQRMVHAKMDSGLAVILEAIQAMKTRHEETKNDKATSV